MESSEREGKRREKNLFFWPHSSSVSLYKKMIIMFAMETLKRGQNRVMRAVFFPNRPRMNKNKPIGARSILASRIDDGVNSRFVLGTAAMLLVILLPSLDRRVKINIYEVISLASQSIPDRGSPRMHISIKDGCICREKERILIVSRLEFRARIYFLSPSGFEATVFSVSHLRPFSRR